MLRVPTHGAEHRPWRQASRGGTREDRTVTSITVSVPPPIADLSLQLPADLVVAVEQAVSEIVALDATGDPWLEALGVLLLRTESVASSKIESIDANTLDYARALHGSKANPSATAMVAATAALHELLGRVSRGSTLALGPILAAHRTLMQHEPSQFAHAGRLRDVQNWIGGSDWSPRNALYVPPPADLVPAAMDDLLAFSNRIDLPVLVQAAVAHAQFESIHPFTDGNGRIGRALVNVILRRRGATTALVVPLASALVARRDDYFDALDEYRSGDAGPVVDLTVAAAGIAAAEARTTALRLAELPGRWAEAVGMVRRNSAAAALLDLLPTVPVFSTDEMTTRLGMSQSSVYAAVDRLAEAGVLRPLFERLRNQVWGVIAVLDELDDLSARIATAARARRVRGGGGTGPRGRSA